MNQQTRSITDDREIDSLTSRIKTLGDSADRWNTRYIVFVALTAVAVFLLAMAGCATAYFQFQALRDSRSLTNAQSELGIVKESKLRNELADKDLQIAGLNEKAGKLNKTAGEALERAGNAEERAGKAESHLAEAQKETAIARREAAEANAKAEVFRLDIAKANESAKQAEARAAEANLELARLKLPRSLNTFAAFRLAMQALGETKYTFVSVFQDEESINFLKSVDAALQEAKWTRGLDMPGFPGIDIYGKGGGVSVPIGFITGVRISVESPDSETIESIPLENLPALVKKALSLNLRLFEYTTPRTPNAAPDKVNVVKGNSDTIRIGIGKKP